MRILRTIVLLAAAAFFMPSPPQEQFGLSTQTGEDPPATELLAAAVSTVADMRDFCSRRAAVCDTAHYLAVKLEGKTKYSIELLYQWASESNGLAMPEQAYDGDVAAAKNAEITGQNTLRLEDLIPEWRAPKLAHQG